MLSTPLAFLTSSNARTHYLELEPDPAKMPACGSCAAPDAPSLRGSCRFAAYCGPACQRAAWAGHRALCKAIQTDSNM